MRLGALARPPQAQLDGFKSRTRRAQEPGQRHLYASEWVALETEVAAGAATAAAGGGSVTVVDDERHDTLSAAIRLLATDVRTANVEYGPGPEDAWPESTDAPWILFTPPKRGG